MMKRVAFCGLILVAAFALAAWSREQAAGTSQEKTVKKTAMKNTSAASGKEMYMSYCAACHGKDGKGDGPAASALKQPPPDLTALAKNNNGKFPDNHFDSILRFGAETPAHGSKDMPTWGPLFRRLQGTTAASDPMVELRISNLREYVKSLQAK